jgi:hypothetical protein
LQYGQRALPGAGVRQRGWKVLRREVRFAKEHKHGGLGVLLSDLGYFQRGVAIANGDGAEISARFAIEAIDVYRGLARGTQQLAQRFPMEAPLGVEAEALAKLVVADLGAQPGIENALIAGEERFKAED